MSQARSTAETARALAGLAPEEVLRHYGLDELLRYLRERGEAEGKLPPEVLDALRKYVDETP